MQAKDITGKVRYGLGATFVYDGSRGSKRNPFQMQQHRYRPFRSGENSGYLGVSLSKEEFSEVTKDQSIGKGFVNNALEFYGFKDASDIETWPIEVTPYRKSRVALCTGKAKVYLIGDAAVGTHFFTGSGVNNGFEQVMYLVDNNLNSSRVCNRYKKFVMEIAKRSTRFIKNVDIDFDKILSKCEKLSDDELYKMAKEFNVPTEKIPRKELCYVLSTQIRRIRV
ncbi:MAG: hypothetical protein EBU90_10280 [Proteobacteria bacterium]|nr:hypothetical protein [Pseudomonadota bacterium]NBP13796.1 hypothetical protein [bacterium]